MYRFCRTLFIDCLVQAGTNPTVMLLKELIETEQITGRKAEFTLMAFGYYVKTPTRELLREIIVSLLGCLPCDRDLYIISLLFFRDC